MAIKDITDEAKYGAPLDYTFHSPFFFKSRVIDFAVETELGTQFTHPILDINVGEALVGFDVIVHTLLVGASATITWQVDAVTWSEIVTAASMTAGMVINYRAQAAQVTAEKVDLGLADAYAHTTANTLDMDVNTADITAGKFLLIGRFVKNVDSIVS